MLHAWLRAWAQHQAGGTRSGPCATGQPWPCQGLGADLLPVPQGPHQAPGSLSLGNSGDLRPTAQPTPSPPRAVHAPMGEGGSARQRDRLHESDGAEEIKPSSAESSQGGNNSAKEDTSPCVTAWPPGRGCQAGGEAGDGTLSSPSTFILRPTAAPHPPRHPPPGQCRMLSRNGGNGGRGGGVWVREAKHGVQSQPLRQGGWRPSRAHEAGLIPYAPGQVDGARWSKASNGPSGSRVDGTRPWSWPPLGPQVPLGQLPSLQGGRGRCPPPGSSTGDNGGVPRACKRRRAPPSPWDTAPLPGLGGGQYD